MVHGKETQRLPGPPHTPVASPQTHCEEEGVVWQGETDTTNEEGQGGQVLDVVTVHDKLQRGRGPRCLEVPPSGPTNLLTSVPRALLPCLASRSG